MARKQIFGKYFRQLDKLQSIYIVCKDNNVYVGCAYYAIKFDLELYYADMITYWPEKWPEPSIHPFLSPEDLCYQRTSKKEGFKEVDLFKEADPVGIDKYFDKIRSDSHRVHFPGWFRPDEKNKLCYAIARSFDAGEFLVGFNHSYVETFSFMPMWFNDGDPCHPAHGKATIHTNCRTHTVEALLMPVRIPKDDKLLEAIKLLHSRWEVA